MRPVRAQPALVVLQGLGCVAVSNIAAPAFGCGIEASRYFAGADQIDCGIYPVGNTCA